MSKRHILSIDGGGVRGIVPTMALVKLEQQTGKLTREVFDFVGGTSTGALIAAAVAAGVPATAIADVYRHRTKEIFSPSGPESDILLVTRGYRYGVEKLYAVVHETLGSCADRALNDLPIDVLLCAVAEADAHPWYFVRDSQGNAQTTGKLPLASCATASGAAPIYFDSFTMPDGRKMVDGGLGVTANPVYQACVEAFEFGAGKYDPAETVVVSLGTGRAPAPRQPAGNLLSKLQWVIDVATDAPRDQQTEMVERHYQPQLAGFHRFDINLSRSIDEADAGSVPELEQYGLKMAADIDWLEIAK